MSADIIAPFLTERDSDASPRILDPLGLDATGAYIVRNSLFPGITGGLRHPRYFSVMVWIVGQYDARADRGIQWRSYRTRLEHALRCATLIHDPDLLAVIGRQSVPDEVISGDAKDVLLAVRAPTAFAAQYYGASLDAIGLTLRDARGVPHLTERGSRLFAAVDELVRQRAEGDPRFARAVDALVAAPESIRREQLQSIGEVLRLRAVTPQDREFTELREAIVGIVAEDGHQSRSDRVRARGFGALLSLIASQPRHFTSSGALLTHWRREKPDPDTLERYPEVCHAWRCFAERQDLRICIGAFWKVVSDWLNAELAAMAPATIMQRAIDLACTHKEMCCHGDLREVRWVDFEAAVLASIGARGLTRTRARFKLTERVRNVDGSGAAGDRLVAALQLLAAVTSAWRDETRSADAGAIALHSHGGALRLVLPWMAAQLERRGEDSVVDVLRWLLEHCVIEQIIRVGFIKAPDTTKVVLVLEEGKVRFARDSKAPDHVALDADRLSGATAMLAGLSLVATEDGAWEITKAGARTELVCSTVSPVRANG